MIQRDRIIRAVLRQVGEVSSYNDNRSDTYTLTNDILTDVLDSLAYRVDLTFNSTTTKLNKYGKNEQDENRFNIPVDFLNKIRFVNSVARLEGEFVYSTADEVVLQYCRKIDLMEYPDYLYELIVLLTATKLCESNNRFTDRLEILNTRAQEELNRIYKIEFVPISRKVVE